MKRLIKRMVVSISSRLSRTRVGEVVAQSVLASAMQKTVAVSHQGVDIEFTTPNPLLHWRATSFASKEPETLAWIDGFGEGETLWDIGANVGLYSLYAAKARRAKVFAFEPSIFNLEILGRNIALNELTNQILIVPTALSDQSGFAKMNHSTTEWGGALSSFGVDFGADGEALPTEIAYQTLGMRADELVDSGLLPQPDHIKIDVDGIEHIILRGASELLKNTKSVLVEINEDFTAQRDLSDSYLTSAGLLLVGKERSIFTASAGSKTPNVYNQIWARAD